MHRGRGKARFNSDSHDGNIAYCHPLLNTGDTPQTEVQLPYEQMRFAGVSSGFPPDVFLR